MIESESAEIELSGGIWRVVKIGDRVCIVDSLGRERHRGVGHMSTAIHLAMQLDKSEFASTDVVDDVLRKSAASFIAEEETKPC